MIINVNRYKTLIGKLKHSGTNADVLQQQLQLQQQALVAAAGIPNLTDGIVNVMQPSTSAQQQQSQQQTQQQGQQQQQVIDTSQPPPIRPPTSAALLPPPNTQLQMMPPAFTMTGVPRKCSLKKLKIDILIKRNFFIHICKFIILYLFFLSFRYDWTNGITNGT